jgi:competence protein ComEA
VYWRLVVAGLLFLSGLAVVVVTFWPRPSPPLAVASPIARPSPTPLALLAVHVVGAVQRPGVYSALSGARVGEVIEQAGGLTDDADSASLNLAARAVDGQQIVVRTRSSVVANGSPVASADGRQADRLNINTASAAELDTLPGVGPVIARRIVERRDRQGHFTSIDQLRDEKLMPASTFDGLKDLVVVS